MTRGVSWGQVDHLACSSKLSVIVKECGSPVFRCSHESQEMTKLNVNKFSGQYFRVNVEINYTAPSICYISAGGKVCSTNTDGEVFAAAIKKTNKQTTKHLSLFHVS